MDAGPTMVGNDLFFSRLLKPASFSSHGEDADVRELCASSESSPGLYPDQDTSFMFPIS